MKIQEFNKQNLQILREEINAALAQVEKKYGIKINAGNASYSSNEVTYKLKANVVASTGKAITKEATQWDMYARMHQLGHLKVGDRISISGREFVIKGYNSRARKAPIQIEDLTGRGYKTTLDTVQRAQKVS